MKYKMSKLEKYGSTLFKSIYEVRIIVGKWNIKYSK